MPTTTTNITRQKLDFPDLGYDGGAGLHTAVKNFLTGIADNSNARYKEYSGVNNSTTSTYEHNLGMHFNQLNVLLYTGSGATKTYVPDPVASGWTIAATTSFEKTKIDITTPASGQPHTFAIAVLAIAGTVELEKALLKDQSGTIPTPSGGDAYVYASGGGIFRKNASTTTQIDTAIEPVANIRSSEGAGTTTLVASDAKHQVFNLSAARTVKMPTTSVSAGAVYRIENRGAFTLTLQSSDATSMTVANGANRDAIITKGAIMLTALQATPTTPAHWFIEIVNPIKSIATFAASGSQSIGTNTVVNFATTEKDTKSEVTNPSTDWKFTALDAGVYRVACALREGGAATGAGQYTDLMVWKNGSHFTFMQSLRHYSGEQYTTVQGQTLIALAASDYIQIVVDTNVPTNTVYTASRSSFVDVEQIA